MPPTVKGMQETHCFFFVISRAGFNDRAYQYFEKSTADRINDNCDYKSGIRGGKNFRKNGE
jgi:hypothetical protein